MTSAPTDPSKGKLLTKEQVALIEANWRHEHDGTNAERTVIALLDHIAAQAALLDQAERKLEDALTTLYVSGCSIKVAQLCDERLDGSGRLLGRIRERALRPTPSPDEEGK